MPYIKNDVVVIPSTDELEGFGVEEPIRDLLKPTFTPRNSGELNYAITMLMHYYVTYMYGESYASISEALSACHEAEAEFRRRRLVPYEDKKIAENGDIF